MGFRRGLFRSVWLNGAPAAGDDVQAMKAGLMEIAQVMVVNKSDIAGADTTVAQLRALLSLASERAWKPPIVQTVARGGEGVGELVDAIDSHQQHLRESEHAADERRALVRSQIVSLARNTLQREALAMAERAGVLDALAADKFFACACVRRV